MTTTMTEPMSTTVTTILDEQARLRRALRDYLHGVAAALGVGLESCTVDLDTPISAYIALDCRLPAFPDRDLALLWDEEHGWSAAIETHSGEDLIVVSYLDSKTVVPPGEVVVAFVRDLRRGARRSSRPDPPAIRSARDGQALIELLRNDRPLLTA